MKDKVKTLIHGAALELLCEKHYLEITVSDIVRKAGVARASFYRHYDSINDVIDEVVALQEKEILDRFLPVLLSGDEENITDALRSFFGAVKKQRSPWVTLLPDNRQYLLGKLNIGPHMLQRYGDLPIDKAFSPEVGFAVITNIASIWARRGFDYSTEEVAAYAYDFIWRTARKRD